MSQPGEASTFELPACFPGFLAPQEARALVAEIDASVQEQAQVWLGMEFGVHPESRLGSVATLSPASEELVQDRLWGVMPALEERYGCEISHVSGVTALIYRRGDHFAAHSDGGVDEEATPEVARRRVSLVVALNDGASDRADFKGGELVFYPHVAPGADPRPRDEVVPVLSEPGLLVAFASPMVHQVMPVIDGCRYSLALWALAPES